MLAFLSLPVLSLLCYFLFGPRKLKRRNVRRELRQFEGAWFDSDKIALSRDRVERLGYFQDVQISNVPVPGVPRPELEALKVRE